MPQEIWQQDVAAFVRANLPSAPARVLEVGSGEGALALELDAAGYDIRAIDPKAPDGPIFEQVTLEEFTTDDRFDAIVAVLSLHHIHDLRAAVAKIRRFLANEGTLVVVEFGWDRFDDATAQWCLDHLDPVSEEGWLDRRRAEWAALKGSGKDIGFADYIHEWALADSLHTSSAMLDELRRTFSTRHFEWSPYLYPDLPGIDGDDERALIEEGRIEPTGFRFVGST